MNPINQELNTRQEKFPQKPKKRKLNLITKATRYFFPVENVIQLQRNNFSRKILIIKVFKVFCSCFSCFPSFRHTHIAANVAIVNTFNLKRLPHFYIQIPIFVRLIGGSRSSSSLVLTAHQFPRATKQKFN